MHLKASRGQVQLCVDPQRWIANFRLQGLGFRASGLGLKVQGLRPKKVYISCRLAGFR